MVIPSEQLNRWSNQGAQTTVINTHTQIRDVLNSTQSKIKGKDFELFLQGSYKNDTNIRSDSDVDLVVMLKSSFSYDTSNLSDDAKQRFHNTYPSATYSWSDFRSDVLSTLQIHYGNRVTQGNKSIKIAGGSNTIDADVVPCLQYRQYTSFVSQDNEHFYEGIRFWTEPDKKVIISYPKIHYDRLVEKNKQTDEWLKPTVRIFKNARSYMESRDIIPLNIAPSYHIESLLYNIPSRNFVNSHSSNFNNCLEWFHRYDFSECTCPTGSSIFGSEEGKWNINSANQFIQQLSRL